MFRLHKGHRGVPGDTAPSPTFHPAPFSRCQLGHALNSLKYLKFRSSDTTSDVYSCPNAPEEFSPTTVLVLCSCSFQHVCVEGAEGGWCLVWGATPCPPASILQTPPPPASFKHTPLLDPQHT